MEEHVSIITRFLNHYLGSAVLALLSALYITPKKSGIAHPRTRVHGADRALVIAIVLALVLRARLSVDHPGAFQQSAEMLITNPMGFGIRDLLEENVHHHPEKYIPLVGSVGILLCCCPTL